MTKEEITIYEYCKKHLSWIADWKSKLHFKCQQYGQGSGVPNIEHTLANIHSRMYRLTIEAMDEAKKSIEKIIEEV